MKKTLSIILAVVLCLAMFTGCAGKKSKDEKVELSIATIYATTHPNHIACENFAEKVKELSGGTIDVVIYPNSQMGSESEIIQQVVNGDLDISCSGGGMWGSYVPALSCFESLFMFRSVE